MGNRAMSLTTTNGKMAVMEWEGLESGFMLSPTGSFNQADRQQLIWGIPEVLWTTPGAATAIMNQIQSSNMGADLYNGTFL